MMSYIIQRMPVRDAMYFPCLSVFVWTGENDSNKLRVDAFFFQNGGKNLCFEKYPDTSTRPKNLQPA